MPLGATRLYVIEGLCSTGATLLTLGVFFYTSHRFGWGLRRNFVLAALQGATYAGGALSAQRLTARLPHARVLVLAYGVMTVVAGAGAVLAGRPLAVAALLLTYGFVSAITWPILESMVTTGVDARGVARRVAMYNLVWPSTGAAAVAVSGAIIEGWPTGLFLVAAAMHLLSVGILLAGRNVADMTAAPSEPRDVPHARPEPELLRVRTMALWVSRIALPATYAVIYGLMPMMPLLPAVKRLDTRFQTLVCSTWLVARWLAFAVLAMSSWWHSRPRALVGAACLMFVAFLGVALPPSLIWGGAVSPALDLAALTAWQALLGLSLGVIYAGSLYFGMVLGEGSTEHGGYHEALIGLGWMLGPVAGAVASWLRPEEPIWGVMAVGGVIGASALTVVIASIILRRRTDAA